MKPILTLLVLLLSVNTHAWNKGPKLPDATKEECTSQGKIFVKRITTKNGIERRAHCRAKAGSKQVQK